MNKNAYEIRLDVLSLAHNDLVHQASQKYELELEQIRTAASIQNIAPDFSGVVFNYPTTDAIRARAEELYQFVECK